MNFIHLLVSSRWCWRYLLNKNRFEKSSKCQGIRSLNRNFMIWDKDLTHVKHSTALCVQHSVFPSCHILANITLCSTGKPGKVKEANNLNSTHGGGARILPCSNYFFCLQAWNAHIFKELIRSFKWWGGCLCPPGLQEALWGLQTTGKQNFLVFHRKSDVPFMCLIHGELLFFCHTVNYSQA